MTVFCETEQRSREQFAIRRNLPKKCCAYFFACCAFKCTPIKGNARIKHAQKLK